MNPAQPKAEGAVILWRSEVPKGWDYRNSRRAMWYPMTAETLGHLLSERLSDTLVEARPPKPKTVMVELPEDVARDWAGQSLRTYKAGSKAEATVVACRKALEA